MNHDELSAALAGMPHATVGEPFAEGVPVYKVAGKVFAVYQHGDQQAGHRDDRADQHRRPGVDPDEIAHWVYQLAQGGYVTGARTL